ncbi:MAG: hypothetical protein FJY95_11155 [Candidatus Handelsmanbacteria bacterium]|nr:hypothetical protein [Candidatus Handelsmanbacteria bacterium]
MRDTYADEFVELHNPGPTALSLEGWRLSDGDTVDMVAGSNRPADRSVVRSSGAFVPHGDPPGQGEA